MSEQASFGPSKRCVMSRRRFVAVTCGTAVPLLLSACGPGTTTATSSVGSSGGAAVATGGGKIGSVGTTSATTAAAQAPAQGRVTVVFTVPGGQAEDDAFKPVFDAFVKKYPAINAVYTPAETGYTSEYDNKLLTSIAGGVGPDVFKIWPASYFGSLSAQGACVDLDPYVAKDATINLPDFFPEHLAACKFQGKLYALPNDGAPVAMWYNVDLFKKYGIALPTAAWTWDTLLTATKQLTK